jgi:hypothetical protein
VSNPVPPPPAQDPSDSASDDLPAPEGRAAESAPSLGEPGTPESVSPSSASPAPGSLASASPEPEPEPEPGPALAESSSASPEPGSSEPGSSEIEPGEIEPGGSVAGESAPSGPASGTEPAAAARFGEVPPEKPKRSIRRVVLSAVGIIAVVIIGGVIMLAVGGGDNDKAQKAKVGDCVAALGKVSDQEGQNSQTAAKVVNCTANDAAFKVIGRVNGKADTDSKACDQYFTDAKADYFIYASTSGDGYLLCLRSTKA